MRRVVWCAFFQLLRFDFWRKGLVGRDWLDVNAFSVGGADENHPDHRGFRIGVAIMAAIRSRGASFGRGVSGRGTSTSIMIFLRVRATVTR